MRDNRLVLLEQDAWEKGLTLYAFRATCSHGPRGLWLIAEPGSVYTVLAFRVCRIECHKAMEADYTVSKGNMCRERPTSPVATPMGVQHVQTSWRPSSSGLCLRR